MMKSRKSKDADEICPMCKRSKSIHTKEEMRACSRKLEEFRGQKEGGAGIQ